MVCNAIKNPFKCIFEDILGLATAFMKGQDWGQDYHGLLLQPSAPNPSNGALLWSQPGAEWEPVWNAVWIGSGEAVMPVIGLLAVLIGYKSRALSTIIGFSGQQTQQEASVKLAFIGALFAYPIAVFALALANGMTELIMPNPDEWSKLMENMYAQREYIKKFQGNDASIAYTITIGLQTMLLAIGTFFWLLILKAREILVHFYIFVFPILIPVRYSGIPVVTDYAQAFMQRYVSVLLIPVVPALMARTYLAIYPNFAFGGLFAPFLFIILTLYLTWKLFTTAAPVASGAIKGGVGVGLAGGVLASGGSGFAAANMLRGRYLSGAIYATNPDFDFRPSEDDTEKD